MSPSRLYQRIVDLSKKKPFLIIQRLLDKIPGTPVQTACFFRLELEKFPSKSLRGFGTVREGTLEDVAAMSALEDKDDQVFTDRFNSGEYCVVATDNDQLTGYEWFSAKACHVEARFQYNLMIQADSLYTYDAFILPEYRIRGIWLLFQKHIAEEMEQMGKHKVVAMVDYGNDPSLKAHIRFGFNVRKKVYMLRVLQKRFFKEFDIPREGFKIKTVLSAR